MGGETMARASSVDSADVPHLPLDVAREAVNSAESLEAASPFQRGGWSLWDRNAKSGVFIAGLACGVVLVASALWMGGSLLLSSMWGVSNLSDEDLLHCGRQIKWKSHPEFCLAAKGPDVYNGTEVVIQKCGSVPHDEWLFTNGSKIRLYTRPSLCLDVRNHLNVDWTKLQLWECQDGRESKTQNFTIAENQALHWSLHPHKCLDVAYHAPVAGMNVQIAPCKSAQTFEIDKCHFNCPRQLMWKTERTCLSLQGWSLEAGVSLVPGPCMGDGIGPTQFLFNTLRGGQMQLALNTKYCVQVNAYSELELAVCDSFDLRQYFEFRRGAIFRSRRNMHLVPSSPVLTVDRSSNDTMEASACQLLYHPVQSFPIPSGMPCPRQLKWDPGFSSSVTTPEEHLCLATMNWHIGNGEPVVLAPCEAGTQVGQRQHWLLDSAEGKLRLASSPSYCLETDHVHKDRLPLHLWQCVYGDDSQVFSIPDTILSSAQNIFQGSRCLTVAREEVEKAHAYTKLDMAECGWEFYRQQRFWTDVCQEKEKAEPPPGDRLGSFLVIGDWGWDPYSHGNVEKADCQTAIGAAMAHKFNDLQDVKFIINVGDSFYPNGVASPGDIRWRTQWMDRYPDILRSVPWYSVYGNHDAHHDPGMCNDEAGAQLGDILSRRNGLFERFYMPDYNWYYTHEELSVEVIALDLNKYMDGWNKSKDDEDLFLSDCEYSSCPETCVSNAERRAQQAMDLVFERYTNTTAEYLLIFSHYPTDYFHSRPDFLELLGRQGTPRIAYFGGHRHNTDQWSTLRTGHHDWLVGGGGGWSCDGREQGFLVGTIDYFYELRTYPVFVDAEVCCPTSASA
ncbi:PAP8 [Symbiodinium natans]|uniref:PAP8 protein n=1 Tax=Symbiodinium natans TaxID=878477 RepID=A0A812QH82_9DINO|nr:PAP8 [Symbiodinium natans]